MSHQTYQQQFLDKSSAQREIKCFFIDPYSAVSDKKFSTYCTAFLKLLRYSCVSYKKLSGWTEVGHLLAANFELHISRCDVEKHCLIIFNAPVMQ